jgi:hypothetical protein
MYAFANVGGKDDFANILCSSCELPPCHVRTSTFALSEGSLTWATFRLNTRDLILERSANLHPQTTFCVGSFMPQQQKEPAHESTSGPTAISVNMPRTTTTDFAPCKHNYSAEPELLDLEKLVRSLHLDAVSAFTCSFFTRMESTLLIWVLNDRSQPQSRKVLTGSLATALMISKSNH